MGMTLNQAAGFAGNFMLESGMDPKITNGIGAHGLAQWLGGRLTGLVNFAKAHNAPEDTIDTQLNYAGYELNNGFKASVLTPVKASSTVQESTTIVFDHYEIAGDSSLPFRIQYALQAVTDYKQFIQGGGTPGGPTPSGGSGVCPSSSTGPSGYVSPFCGAKVVSDRIDQGVDFSAQAGGAICAMTNGTITDVQPDPPAQWPGYEPPWYFIRYKVADGPAQGLYIYMSEDCRPVGGLHSGQQIHAGDKICNMPPGQNVIETGWAKAPSYGWVAMAHDWYVEGMATVFGVNFSDLLKSLGAPSGDISLSTSRDTHSLPPGWPKW
jgi:hypothetical protein